MEVNESDREKLSELIFIKNGKAIRKKFPYIEGKDSPEEEKLIMSSLGVSKEEYDKLMQDEKYGALTDSGWTVIRKISDSSYRNSMYIGNPITIADYEIIMNLLNSPEENIKLEAEGICNRVNFKYGRQFESAVFTGGQTPAKIADLFMRDKLGKTTDSEKEMLEHFRTFDLERIVTAEDFKYPINNGRAGVIVITPDEFFTNSCSGTFGQHGSAASNIMLNKYNSLYRKHRDYSFINGPETFNSVMIQCTGEEKESEFIIWTASKINEFQYEKLVNLQNAIQDISKRVGRKVSIWYTVKDEHGNEDERNVSVEEYKEYLLKNHDSMVDNLAVNPIEKSSMPKYKNVTEEDICSALEIEPESKDSAAKKVRGELFQKAKDGLNLLSSNIRGLFQRDVDKEI